MAALSSNSSQTVRGAGPLPRARPTPSPAPVREQAAAKVSPSYKPQSAPRSTPGVEPGVSGKEKRFQQSQQFGPGPIKPYPYSKRSPAPNKGQDSGSGVYRGGWGSRAIPTPEANHNQTPGLAKRVATKRAEWV